MASVWYYRNHFIGCFLFGLLLLSARTYSITGNVWGCYIGSIERSCFLEMLLMHNCLMQLYIEIN